MPSFEEKYAPQSLYDFVFPDELSERGIRNWIKTKSTRPLLLYGGNGTGKSTLATLLHAELYPEYRAEAGSYTHVTIVDPSDKGKSALEKFKSDAWYDEHFRGTYRVVVLDEVHNFSHPMQESLNKVLNDKATQGHFAFTTNHIERLIPSLKSRCKKIPFGPADSDGWLPRLKMIYRNEGVPIPPDDEIKRTIEYAMGDARDILEQAQDYVCDVSRLAERSELPIGEEPSI